MKKLAVILILSVSLILGGCGENEYSVGIVRTDASDALRVRQEPDGNSPVVMLLPNGEEIAILAEENEFYKISWQEEGETAEGYVRKEFVDVE